MKKPLVRQSHKTKRVLASCGSAAVRREGRLAEMLLGIAEKSMSRPVTGGSFAGDRGLLDVTTTI